ncbi:MAG TPA: carboxypeptidase-like regulatory domain-containing protein [Candidatus Nanoarchaeia archaeon]|nr:carboxypeptidase-like regulatory domain-containing protein [Candidatus Nanoarchaeia archaeon]
MNKFVMNLKYILLGLIIVLAILVMLILYFTGSPLSPTIQVHGSEVQGRVVDPSGAPIQNVSVELNYLCYHPNFADSSSSERFKELKTKTDSDGAFYFDQQYVDVRGIDCQKHLEVAKTSFCAQGPDCDDDIYHNGFRVLESNETNVWTGRFDYGGNRFYTYVDWSFKKALDFKDTFDETITLFPVNINSRSEYEYRKSKLPECVAYEEGRGETGDSFGSAEDKCLDALSEASFFRETAVWLCNDISGELKSYCLKYVDNKPRY